MGSGLVSLLLKGTPPGELFTVRNGQPGRGSLSLVSEAPEARASKIQKTVNKEVVKPRLK